MRVAAAVSLAIVAGSVFVGAARPPYARSLLFARQGSVPTLPGGGGWGNCDTVCQKWDNDLLACANATATATATDDSTLMQCYCKDSYMSEMTQCYDCLAPLIQSAGTDPTFVSDAQVAINDLEDACAEAGASVASQTIVPDSGSTAAATTSAGGSPDTTAAPSAGQTAAGGSSTSGAPSPSKSAGASGSSGAAGAAAGLSFAVVSGAVGVILAVLAA